jgi:hypothetical protein
MVTELSVNAQLSFFSSVFRERYGERIIANDTVVQTHAEFQRSSCFERVVPARSGLVNEYVDHFLSVDVVTFDIFADLIAVS